VGNTLSTISELIEASKQGNLDAFEELVVLYQDRVYTHCIHLTNNEHDAQDLAQDVFIQAYKSIGSFRNEADLGTWLHRIAVNQWINICRKNRKIIAFSLNDPLQTTEGELNRELAATDETPQEKVEQNEMRELLYAAMNQLPADFKTALVLREMEGYSYDEIAALLNCSLGTVKSRISRGRKALKSELKAIRKKFL
jgi:RNA polymerase sigma-70 factor (ECF subfamily)